MNVKPAAEERVWAVLAHLSAIAFGMGIFLPVIGWSEQRRKSNYATFQSLQALGYQSLGYTIWMLTALIVMVFGMVGFLSRLQNIDALKTDLNAWAVGTTALMMGLIGLYVLPPLVAAVACTLGRDFRYPIMGNRLANYLGYESTNAEQPWLIAEHEERWVAAMGHLAVIIMLWGILAPVTAWTLRGRRSSFLKFQSIQTIVYQTGITLLYLAAGFLYGSGLMVFLLTVGFEGGFALDSSKAMLGAIVFLVLLLIAALIALVIPFFHILGQWAGYRVLKGDEYRYPILGRLVEGWTVRRNVESASLLTGEREQAA